MATTTALLVRQPVFTDILSAVKVQERVFVAAK